MKVHEIMTAHARCAAPDNSLVEAAGLMRELDVGVLPVCDDDRLAGMVTDRDIVLRGVADGRDAYETTVRDVMSPGVVWVFADQEVEEAARIMEEKQIRRLPVLNREKRLVGILSLGDVAVSSNPAFSGQALKEVSETPDEHMRGGRTASSVRSDRMAARRETEPSGTRRIPKGSRQSGDRARTTDTGEGQEVERRETAERTGGKEGGSADRRSRRTGRDTTHDASGRAAGAGNRRKTRTKKRASAGGGGRTKRRATIRAAR